MKRVVITGATGAIGIALVQKCIKEKTQVLVICRKGSRRVERIPKHPLVQILECDLSDLKNLSLQGNMKYDIFYHFAWASTFGDGRNDMPTQIKNIEYTLDAVELAERMECHTFIGAGSQAEYGRVEGSLSEKTPTLPENGYGMAKLCAGQMSRIECSKKGICHIWTRILSVYGPYDGEKTMIQSVIQKLLAGEKPSLTLGEQKWDYIYSGDIAEAMYLLGDKGVDGSTYCIGSGQAIPLREYIEQLRDYINPELNLGFGDISYDEKQVMYLCADISKLRQDTGFVPKTDFETGIKNTIEWVKKG